MKIYKFTEVLNDTISYFLLGDILALKNYKDQNKLPDDLATEFTTNETGDNVVKDGILIPLSDIENFPYTIIFNLSGEIPELLKDGYDLQVQQNGYILKVENNHVMLFTWWILNNFTNDKIEEQIKHQKEFRKPEIEVENGYYKVEILGGQTVQFIEIINQQGEKTIIKSLEPTYEFIFSKTTDKDICTADIFKSYKLKSDNY